MQRAEKQLNDFLAALKCDAKQKDALLTACSVHRSLDQLFAERCA